MLLSKRIQRYSDQMSNRIAKTTLSVILVIALLFTSVAAASAKPSNDEAPPEKLDLRDETLQKETILDLIFGSEARLPTERGILIIDAFEDLNINGVKDGTEPALSDQIFCTIDKIIYSVPAFIPGLSYNSRYTVRCSSENYSLYSPPEDVFIERRGHVIEISLPCGKN
jgi:hypothetical protein